MKKLLLFVLIIFSRNVFAQDYHFDKAILYKETNLTLNNIRYISIFINSKSNSYYFINKSWGNEMDCFLVDNNLNITHNYYTEDIKNTTDLTYLNSRKFNPSNCNVNCEKFVVFEEKIDSINTKIISTQFKNKKRKKINYQYETTLKVIDFPLLNTMLKILQHHYLFCQELDTTQNNIPTNVKFTCDNGCDIIENLVSIKDIDVNFNVKKEEIKFIQ